MNHDDSKTIHALVQRELSQVADDDIRRAILATLMPVPKSETRTWDYGSPPMHVVWIVANVSDTEQVLYSPTGHGPEYPWGLSTLGEETLGSDDRWHRTLLDAFLCSSRGGVYRPDDYEVP